MNNESTTGECKRNNLQHEKSITQKKVGQKKCNMQRLQLNEVQHEKSAAQKNSSSERLQYENCATWMQHKKWNTIKYYRKNFKEKQHENSAIWKKTNMELV